MNSVLIDLSWEISRAQMRQALNADKSSALHLQICATQTLISFCRKVAEFMNLQ